MYDVDTLFVISSARGAYPLDDMVSAITAHNPSGSHFIVVVDETSKLSELTVQGAYQIVHPDASDDIHPGFKRAQGLKWAIDQGVAYKQVIMLDDTCLVRGGPIGDFWLDHIQKDNRLGAIGVGYTPNYSPRWRSLVNMLYELKLPHQGWEKVPPALHDAFLVLSPQLVGHMYQQKLLVPPGPERWTATYGAYMSWVAQMLGFHIVSWGYTHKVLPPLFVAGPGQMAPAPHILADRFMVFSSVRDVAGYSESDIREMFKQYRGEQARQVPSFGPTVCGPDQQGQTP